MIAAIVMALVRMLSNALARIVDLYNRSPIGTKVVVLVTAISCDTAKPIGPQGVTGLSLPSLGRR
jgi:hypothetical protein